MMTSMARQWIIPAALFASGVIWLGVSSVTANAVHVLAKSNFALLRPYGSVSAWLLASAIGWPLLVGYALSVSATLPTKGIALSICAVAAWCVFLVGLTAVGDGVLISLGSGAVVIWLAEIAVAVLLMRATNPQLLSRLSWQGVLIASIAAFAWLSFAKALLLGLSPGVSVKI